MNGDITLEALCHCQRASKVISPFIIFCCFRCVISPLYRVCGFTWKLCVLDSAWKCEIIKKTNIHNNKLLDLVRLGHNKTETTAKIYRVGQIKRHHLTFLLVTIECANWIQWFSGTHKLHTATRSATQILSLWTCITLDCATCIQTSGACWYFAKESRTVCTVLFNTTSTTRMQTVSEWCSVCPTFSSTTHCRRRFH